MEYQEYVEKGKACLAKIENYQMQICSYAMEVCEIRHGGRSDKLYTIGKYAKDIGMNAKTLQNWLLTYRNVILKLTPEQRKNCVWQNASKVESLLKESQTLNNAAEGKRGRKTGWKKDVDPKQVQSLYKKFEDNGKPFENEFINMVQSIKFYRGLLMKRDLGIIDPKQLIVFMEILDECSEIVNDYLTKKRKTA